MGKQSCTCTALVTCVHLSYETSVNTGVLYVICSVKKKIQLSLRARSQSARVLNYEKGGPRK